MKMLAHSEMIFLRHYLSDNVNKQMYISQNQTSHVLGKKENCFKFFFISPSFCIEGFMNIKDARARI